MKCQLFTFYNIRVFGDVSPSLYANAKFFAKRSYFQGRWSGWGGGGDGKKHEIYAAAFSNRLFMTYFYRAGGPCLPWIRY